MGVPVGITLGQVAFFQVTLSPPGSSIDPATALWTCSDPAATFTPSLDGLTVAVATLTTDTLSSLQMGFGATGATVNGVPGVAFTVPALSVPLSGGGTGGGVISATGGSIAQIAAPGSGSSASWLANTAETLNQTIVDPNGNTQTVTTAGTTGASIPTFATALNGTTSDGSVVWTLTALAVSPVSAAFRRR